MTAIGIDPVLEQWADEMLAEDRRRSGDTSIASRQFILSPDQLEYRQRREVYNKNGFPQPHVRQGVFHRAWNPLIGKRPTGKRWHDPEYDSRVPHGTSAPSGYFQAHWPVTSPCWAVSAPQGLFWHLSAGQRSRIRRLYRLVGPGLAREALKNYLSDFYGVPPWVISRVAISSSRCHT